MKTGPPYGSPTLPYQFWQIFLDSQQDSQQLSYMCQESSPASSLSPPEGATSLPPGLITSLHTPVHPLITSLHTHVHLLITLSCSQCVDYLCTSAPSLCLPRLPLPALTCACMYVHYISCLTDYIRFRALGTPALRCRLGCPVADYCFVFACWLLI